MKLVIIYGPPAVGKLTVAKALAKATDFKLLHNHLVSDMVLSVFERNTPAAISLSASIKNLIFETAAKNKQKGIIATFLYDSNKKDQIDQWCKDCLNIMSRYKAKAYFIRLSAPIKTLKKRVLSPSRLGTKKIRSSKKLIKVIRQEGSFGKISKNITQSLHIENTDITPEGAVEIIKSYCGL